MKKIAFLMILTMVPALMFGQKKSKEEAKDMQVDSLTTVAASLSAKNDSLSLELVKYVGVYDAIKENILHYNFDPTRTEFLIDSLKTSRDSAMIKAAPTTETALLKDSVSMLKAENMMLRSALDSMKIAVDDKLNSATSIDVEKAKAIMNLRQLRELVDAKIITEAEYITLKKKYLEKL